MTGINLIAIIQQYRYLIIYPLTIFEGPLVTILVGYLTAHGDFEFFTAYVVLILGDLSGDALYYALGRAAHYPSIIRWRNWFGLSDERIRAIQERFGTVTGKTILLGKVLHGFGTAILISAGLTKMPFRQFIAYNALGTIPKTLLFLLVGFFFGAAYETINHYLRLGAEVGIGALILTIIVAILVLQFPKSTKKKRQE